MRLEAERGSLHKARAEQKFIAAVQESLPREAFDEIEASTLGDELAWARKWGVNSPCIMNVLPAWRDGFRVASYQAAEIPETWRQTLKELNFHPVAAHRHLPSMDVATEEEVQQEQEKLLKWAQDHPSLSAYVSTTLHFYGDIPAASPDAPNLKRIRTRARQEQLRHELAPLGADPATESFEEFSDRAHKHWDARTAVARKHRLEPALNDKKWREFARDLKWLIRYQVHREEFSEIAENSGSGYVGREAIRKAVRRLAIILGLEYRAGRRGGARRRR